MMTSIASVICTIIAISLIVYVAKSKSLSNQAEQKNSKGYYIIRGGEINKLIINFMFVVSIVIFWLARGESGAPNDALVLLLVGIFFIIIGLFLMSVLTFNRIEYNESEISQYSVFKRPKTIQWNDADNIELKQMGILLELRGPSEKIYIDLRGNGAVQLLRLMGDKLKDENILD